MIPPLPDESVPLRSITAGQRPFAEKNLILLAKKCTTIESILIQEEAEISGKDSVGTVTVEAEEAEINVPNTKDAPSVKNIVYKIQFMGGNYYTVAFKNTANVVISADGYKDLVGVMG